VSEAELDDFVAELGDRFGPPPAEVEQLVELARLRVWAHRRRVDAVHLEGKYAVLTYSDRGQLGKLVARSGGKLRVADERSAYLPLDGVAEAGVADASAPGASTLLEVLKALLRPDSAAS
jgi:transcription-repair coupling factor (superfamily II helicase)